MAPPPPVHRPGESPEKDKLRRAVAVALLAAVATHLSACTLEREFGPAMDMLNRTCTWPTCVKTCEPCIAKRVGECISKLLGADLRYMCETNTTECVLGRCVCSEGYCAGERTMEGLMEADPSRLRSCVPQTCYEGARPPQHYPNAWVTAFASMSLATSFRYARHPLEEWRNYAMTTSLAAAVLLMFGAGIAVCTWIGLCSGHGCFRGKSGCEFSCFCCGRRRGNLDCVDSLNEVEDILLVDERQRHSRGPGKPPSPWPMTSASIGIFSLCALSMAVRQHNWVTGSTIIKTEMHHISQDIERLAVQGKILQEITADMSDVLHQIQESCYLSDPILVRCTKDASTLIVKMSTMLDKFVNATETAPEKMAGIFKQVQDKSVYGKLVPLVPLLAMALASFLPVSLAVLTAVCRRHDTARSLDRCYLYTAVVPFLIILIVSVFTAVELAACTAVSVICTDVDDFVVDYSQLAKQEDVIQAARFYIKGDVTNPLVEYVDLATMYVDQIQSLYREFRSTVDIIGLTCWPLFGVDVPKLAVTAKSMLVEARSLIEARNVWPYYREIVQRGLCDHLMGTLGYLILVQFIIGLLLFPLSALLTHRFLVRLDAWQRLRKQAARRFKVASGAQEHAIKDAKSDSSGSEGSTQGSDDEGHSEAGSPDQAAEGSPSARRDEIPGAVAA